MVKRLSYFRNLSTDSFPPILYFDTSFLVRVLVQGEGFHSECVSFINRLALLDYKEQPYIVFSELLKTELRCAIISICIRDRFGKDIKVSDRIRVNPELLREFLPIADFAEECLLGIMRRFTNWACIPLNDKINEKSRDLIGKYRLGSYDAIHIATMEDWGIKDIVAFDWGIDELPNYTSCFVWTCGERERKAYSLRLRRDQSRNNNLKSEAAIVIDAEDILRSKIIEEDLPEPDTTTC